MALINVSPLNKIKKKQSVYLYQVLDTGCETKDNRHNLFNFYGSNQHHKRLHTSGHYGTLY